MKFIKFHVFSWKFTEFHYISYSVSSHVSLFVPSLANTIIHSDSRTCSKFRASFQVSRTLADNADSALNHRKIAKTCDSLYYMLNNKEELLLNGEWTSICGYEMLFCTVLFIDKTNSHILREHIQKSRNRYA